jgi:hypothetical protein
MAGVALYQRLMRHQVIWRYFEVPIHAVNVHRMQYTVVVTWRKILVTACH